MHSGEARRLSGDPPLIVSLNCLDDLSIEQESLSGFASLQHIPLSSLSSSRLSSASAVLLHSLAFLPRAAQRRLRPWQLLLCLGSPDPAVDSALAADLGLRLVHVDTDRSEEVADTVMALVLGLLRKTHLLSRYSASAGGWLGSVQPLCRGMRRCRGLVMGIVGRSASARCLATRGLAFRMSVLYFDPRYNEGKGKVRRPTIVFPPAARRMDTLNDLLAASDVISLHCSLATDTMHILNADCLQHIKPGAFIVNTGSCQLIDDCALKQLLIDGTIAGCALDGAEGPQWMEAWVREMPNVLILPRSADYSEEVWMEIREKAISILQSYFFEGIIPPNTISDEEEEEQERETEDEEITEALFDDEVNSSNNNNDSNKADKRMKEDLTSGDRNLEEEKNEESQLSSEFDKRRESIVSVSSAQVKEPQSVASGSRSEGRRSGSRKKGKKRPARRRSKQKHSPSSLPETDNAAARDSHNALSSSSRFASPDNESCAASKQKTGTEVAAASEERGKGKGGFRAALVEGLREGVVVGLRGKEGYYAARRREGGWVMDLVGDVSGRDPAAQFLLTFQTKDTFGLRSFASGGKLLQVSRRMEFVFASHSFDVWESWMLEGSSFQDCKLINCRNPTAVLDVCIEILAAVNEEDGVTRWLD